MLRLPSSGRNESGRTPGFGSVAKQGQAGHAKSEIKTTTRGRVSWDQMIRSVSG